MIVIFLIIGLICGIWSLPTTISTDSAVKSLLPMKNAMWRKIEFEKAFPKSPEVAIYELLEKKEHFNTFINQLVAINLTTFDEFMIELKKQQPSTYEVTKEMQDRIMEKYNSLENGKGKELVKAGYELVWESVKAYLLMVNPDTVNFGKQSEILERLHKLARSQERLMEGVPDSEWDSLVELFPLTVAAQKDNLPERIRKRLSDNGIIETQTA